MPKSKLTKLSDLQKLSGKSKRGKKWVLPFPKTPTDSSMHHKALRTSEVSPSQTRNSYLALSKKRSPIKRPNKRVVSMGYDEDSDLQLRFPESSLKMPESPIKASQKRKAAKKVNEAKSPYKIPSDKPKKRRKKPKHITPQKKEPVPKRKSPRKKSPPRKSPQPVSKANSPQKEAKPSHTKEQTPLLPKLDVESINENIEKLGGVEEVLMPILSPASKYLIDSTKQAAKDNSLQDIIFSELSSMRVGLSSIHGKLSIRQRKKEQSAPSGAVDYFRGIATTVDHIRKKGMVLSDLIEELAKTQLEQKDVTEMTVRLSELVRELGEVNIEYSVDDLLDPDRTSRQLQVEVEVLRNDVDTRNKEIQQLQDVITQSRILVETLEKKVGFHEEQHSEMADTLQLYIREKEQLEIERMELTKKCEKLLANDTAGESQGRLTYLKRQLTDSRDRCYQLEQTISKQNRQLDELRRGNSSVDRRGMESTFLSRALQGEVVEKTPKTAEMYEVRIAELEQALKTAAVQMSNGKVEMPLSPQTPTTQPVTPVRTPQRSEEDLETQLRKKVVLLEQRIEELEGWKRQSKE
ncbi:hypothetical protein PCE1_003369 [Barthelona sp. PCE]